jgi:hypothetical protein
MKPVIAASDLGSFGMRFARTSFPSYVPVTVISPSGPFASPRASPRSPMTRSIVPLPTAALPGSPTQVFSFAFFGGSTAPTFAVYEPEKFACSTDAPRAAADPGGAPRAPDA